MFIDSVTYFANCVNGTCIRIAQNDLHVIVHNCPMFPLNTWHVHEQILQNGDRTNNRTAGRNRRFSRKCIISV